MTYEEWQGTVPEEIRGDSVWRVEAYRLALFAADLGWLDVCALANDRRTVGLADQLYRALGSVGANVEEGYSRGTGKDRAHFYEYALGSARERADGTTRVDTSSARKLPSTAFGCLPQSSAFS